MDLGPQKGHCPRGIGDIPGGPGDTPRTWDLLEDVGPQQGRGPGGLGDTPKTWDLLEDPGLQQRCDLGDIQGDLGDITGGLGDTLRTWDPNRDVALVALGTSQVTSGTPPWTWGNP